MQRWDPADYQAHSNVQQAWARELIPLLDLQPDERLLDLGCGDGKVTAEIARLLTRGAVVGIGLSMVRLEVHARKP